MISELLSPGSRVLCAVSGGSDSMALLHLLRLRADLKVCAAHFEHGLRGEETLRDAAFDLAAARAASSSSAPNTRYGISISVTSPLALTVWSRSEYASSTLVSAMFEPH